MEYLVCTSIICFTLGSVYNLAYHRACPRIGQSAKAVNIEKSEYSLKLRGLIQHSVIGLLVQQYNTFSAYSSTKLVCGSVDCTNSQYH